MPQYSAGMASGIIDFALFLHYNMSSFISKVHIMITYNFTTDKKTPLYEQLYRFIKEDILSGRLKPGEKLPSKRNLASHLGVSTITVENSYAQLADEGYICSKPKSGFYVSDVSGLYKLGRKSVYPSAGLSDPASAKNGKPDNGLYDSATAKEGLPYTSFSDPVSLKGKLSFSGFSDSAAKKDSPFIGISASTSEQEIAPLADFSGSSPEKEGFPFSVWARMMRETISEKSEKLMEKSEGRGIRELRLAIAKQLYEYRGMRVDADSIVIGAGTEYLYSLLIQLLGRDKCYCVEDPGYKTIEKVYRLNNVVPVYAELDGDGILVYTPRPDTSEPDSPANRISKLPATRDNHTGSETKELPAYPVSTDKNLHTIKRNFANRHALSETPAQIVHISPTHHFPTGITMPVTRRYELLNWALEKEDRYIIEDDYDSEFRLSGRPIPALKSIDAGGRVIYMNTFSKSLASTIRISYMVLPEKLNRLFEEKLGFLSCTVSNFEQYTLAKFMSEGHFEKHINRQRLYYSRKREELIKAIKQSTLSEKATIIERDLGLHFLLRFETGLSDKELQYKLKKRGIIMIPLSEYYANPDEAPCSHEFILNYTGLNMTGIRHVLNIINDCLSG